MRTKLIRPHIKKHEKFTNLVLTGQQLDPGGLGGGGQQLLLIGRTIIAGGGQQGSQHID